MSANFKIHTFKRQSLFRSDTYITNLMRVNYNLDSLLPVNKVRTEVEFKDGYFGHHFREVPNGTLGVYLYWWLWKQMLVQGFYSKHFNISMLLVDMNFDREMISVLLVFVKIKNWEEQNVIFFYFQVTIKTISSVILSKSKPAYITACYCQNVINFL